MSTVVICDGCGEPGATVRVENDPDVRSAADLVGKWDLCAGCWKTAYGAVRQAVAIQKGLKRLGDATRAVSQLRPLLDVPKNPHQRP